MGSRIPSDKLDGVIAFHGRLCPGLASGVRVAEIALRELGPRAPDEEMVAVAESHSCAVDAIQCLLGCTVGKGNLVLLDHGKQAFGFVRRSDGVAIRVVGKPGSPPGPDAEEKALLCRLRSGQASAGDRQVVQTLLRRRARVVLEAEEDELFEIRLLEAWSLPDMADLALSIPYGAGGELTSACWALHLGGKSLRLPCTEAALASRITMRPIGIVHSELGPHRSSPPGADVRSTITVYPEYADGLLAIGSYEKLSILFHFDRASIENVPLQQHPMGNRGAPVRGVFALCSPRRPSPIGLTTVTLAGVEGNVLTVSGLDAWDGTPVLDIKPFFGP